MTALIYIHIYISLSLQNTALHIGAREGHVSAVLLLLSRGAEIVLSRNQTSFLHEALLNCRQDVVNAVIDSDRYQPPAPRVPPNQPRWERSSPVRSARYGDTPAPEPPRFRDGVTV